MNMRQQELLLRKINYFNKLSPNAYGIVNLTLQEVCESLSVVETDCNRLWKHLNDAYGADFFLVPVERQYGRRFARDYDALHSEVDKVKDEAKYHISTIINQSENELGTLRKIIDDRQQEITQLHEKFYHDIEKAKVELMFTMETDFQAREARTFQKNDVKMTELYRKIKEQEELNENFNKILMKEKMRRIVSSLFHRELNLYSSLGW